MAASVVHWEISAKNSKFLQDFYSNLFGWNINADNPIQYGMVDTGLKMGINGGIYQGTEQEPHGVVVYTQVEDIQTYLDKAVSLGGKIILPINEIPNMVTYAMFADVEGNVMGLIKGPQSVPEKPKKKKPVRKQKKNRKILKVKRTTKKKARK
ncbi:MAG: VOC family protein [Bacteroidota bacterium]|jgi:predicted enzyme related to lactoylglutathione lyase